jgi:hypothetical protein
VYRVLIDDPSQNVLLTSRPEGHDVYPWFQISADGTKAASFFPWATGGVLTIATNGFQAVTNGCWSGMASDNSLYWFHLAGDHRSLNTFRDTQGIANVGAMPPIEPSGQIYCPRAAEGPQQGGRFFTLSGGYPGYNQNGDTVEIFLGRWNSSYSGIEGWARITNNGAPDQHPTAWIGVEGGTPPPPVSIDYFVADPTSITAGGSSTLSWGTSNATAVALDGQGVGASGSTQVWPGATTTYTLVADGQNGPVSQQVTVNVSVPSPVLTSIEVSPGGASIEIGASQQFTAQPKDQYGQNFSATVNWGVNGGGWMNPASGGTSTFTSDGTAGTYMVTAASGSVSTDVWVTVVDPSALHIRLDCGTDSPVAGWESGNNYVSGGSDFTFGGSPDTTGVANAAPPEVYRTCRHQDPSYNITAVPNSTYLLRIHFYDEAGGRSMKVVIEGQTKLRPW